MPRVLIFSHFSERDGTALLRCIANSLQDHNIQLQYVILSTYDERRDGWTRIGISFHDDHRTQAKYFTDRNLTTRFSPEIQERYATFWRSIDRVATVTCERSIEEALHRAKEIGVESDGMQTLVTGRG